MRIEITGNIEQQILACIKCAIRETKKKLNGICPSDISAVLNMTHLAKLIKSKLDKLVDFNYYYEPFDGEVEVQILGDTRFLINPSLEEMAIVFDEAADRYLQYCDELEQDLLDARDGSKDDYYTIKTMLENNTALADNMNNWRIFIEELPFIGRYIVDTSNMLARNDISNVRYIVDNKPLRESIRFVYIINISSALHSFFYRRGITCRHYYINDIRKRLQLYKQKSKKIIRQIKMIESSHSMPVEKDLFRHIISEY